MGRNCQACGNEVRVDDKFCDMCGEKLVLADTFDPSAIISLLKEGKITQAANEFKVMYAKYPERSLQWLEDGVKKEDGAMQALLQMCFGKGIVKNFIVDTTFSWLKKRASKK